MNKREAYELLELIEQDAVVGPADVCQLGNGEWVVVIKARQYHLWSRDDYYQYLSEKQQAKQDEAYKAWCKAGNLNTLKITLFGTELGKKYKKQHLRNGYHYFGVRLRTDDDPTEDPNRVTGSESHANPSQEVQADIPSACIPGSPIWNRFVERDGLSKTVENARAWYRSNNRPIPDGILRSQVMA